MRNSGPAYLIVAMLFLSGIEGRAQETHALDLQKCARFELGGILGNTFFSDSAPGDPGIHISYNYGIRFGQHFIAGIGSAVRIFPHETFVPAYLNLVVTAGPAHNNPYLDLKAGYALGWSTRYQSFEESRYRGGPCISAALGYRYRLNQRFCLGIQCTYNLQNTHLEYQDAFSVMKQQSYNYHQLGIDLALMFTQ